MPSRIPSEIGAFLHATPPEARAPGAGAEARLADVSANEAVPTAGRAPIAEADPVDPAAIAGSDEAGVGWLPWGTAAFARAQASGRPVLLSIVTSWSAACRAQESELFGQPPRHPELIRLIRDLTVPIRVDADRRPDIADRYTDGGWPTTLLLTPEGDPLAGGTELDPSQLAAIITGASAALSTRRHELALRADALRAARRAAPDESAGATSGAAAASALVGQTSLKAAVADAAAGGAGGAAAGALAGAGAGAGAGVPAEAEAERNPDPEADLDEDFGDRAGSAAADEPGAAALAWITDCLLAAFDPEHGGFRLPGMDDAGAKFPHAGALAFALWQGTRTNDARLVELVLVTLERMAASGLSAPDGAFHRGCAAADWSEPDDAKLLETQAELIPLYLDAWTLSGADAFRTRALSCLDFVFHTLTDERHGGFFASQAADGSVDRLLLTDANARMVGALVRAGRVLDEPDLVARAVRALERLLPVVYQRRAGVAHLLVPAGVTGAASVPGATTASGSSTAPVAPAPSVSSVSSVLTASPALAALTGARRAPDADRAQVRGLLADQVLMSDALLDAGIAAGEPVYIELAEELMRSALRSLSHPSGGFADRIRSAAGAGDVGLLAEPLRPFGTNAAAARVLLRLGRDANRPDLLAAAHATLRWLHGTYREQGISSAELGLTLLEAAAR